ncbi:MAG: hypothetical protein AAGF26_18345 [Cyanobacteria bacterium P01_G01_bin.49]
MTALTTTDIPNQINTVERLLAWAGLALGFINPTKAIVEAAGENPERVIQSFVLRADDGSERLIIRAALPLDPNWRSNDTDAFWLNVTDLENVDLPTAYTNG